MELKEWKEVEGSERVRESPLQNKYISCEYFF